ERRPGHVVLERRQARLRSRDPHGSGKGRRLRGGRRSRKDERPRRRNGERRALGRAGPDPFPEQEDPERQESREQQAFFHVVLRARDWAGGFRAHGTGSNPPGRNGWQRTRRASASHAPRRKPERSLASPA